MPAACSGVHVCMPENKRDRRSTFCERAKSNGQKISLFLKYFFVFVRERHSASNVAVCWSRRKMTSSAHAKRHSASTTRKLSKHLPLCVCSLQLLSCGELRDVNLRSRWPDDSIMLLFIIQEFEDRRIDSVYKFFNFMMQICCVRTK